MIYHGFNENLNEITVELDSIVEYLPNTSTTPLVGPATCPNCQSEKTGFWILDESETEADYFCDDCRHEWTEPWGLCTCAPDRIGKDPDCERHAGGCCEAQ